jgi:hypothetical protein
MRLEGLCAPLGDCDQQLLVHDLYLNLYVCDFMRDLWCGAGGATSGIDDSFDSELRNHLDILSSWCASTTGGKVLMISHTLTHHNLMHKLKEMNDHFPDEFDFNPHVDLSS